MRDYFKGRTRRNSRLWKEIIREFEVGPTPDVSADGVILRRKKTDPSLRTQLHERSGMPPEDRHQAYLNACQKAPNASRDTKAKWRRVLGL